MGRLFIHGQQGTKRAGSAGQCTFSTIYKPSGRGIAAASAWKLTSAAVQRPGSLQRVVHWRRGLRSYRRAAEARQRGARSGRAAGSTQVRALGALLGAAPLL